MTEMTLEMDTPRCVAEDFDGEIVALNVDNGVYCSMRGAGAALWRDLAEGRPVEQLATALTAAGGDGRLIETFAATLVEHGLMRAAAAPSAATGAPGFLSSGVPPDEELRVESFFDMQSLIQIDPVHEVDANRGWPAKPNDPAAG